MELLDNKAQVGGIQDFIMAIVGIAVVLAVGLIVLEQLQTTTTAGSTAYNATGDISSQLGTIPVWIGIIIVVAMAFIVLSFFMKK